MVPKYLTLCTKYNELFINVTIKSKILISEFTLAEMWEYWHVTMGVVTANKILLFFTFAFQRKNLFISPKIYSYLYYVVCRVYGEDQLCALTPID